MKLKKKSMYLIHLVQPSTPMVVRVLPSRCSGLNVDSRNYHRAVAPSTPTCEIQGKAEYGKNLNLTCVSEEGMPTPIYSWTSQDVRNMPRVADPEPPAGGLLSLYNISKDASGY
ncbi:Cell surface A33 antigen [Liparis tanakae]|uniref:Cell surface A33 antigen n=1 Tax=Liparis tanakae TaxID=230148 RepID=A0A4Z2FMX0_9TELE|nr:Cell surface A33 antigen [Liparis tanakae]